MDNIVLEKIDNLTNGIYAKEYFTKMGLNHDDAILIREMLKEKVMNENLDPSLLEIQLNHIISKYCYDKNITQTYDDKIVNSYEEKLMIYKLNANKKDITCSNCKKELIKEFNYCPYCGSKNKQVTLKIVTEGNVDLTKGYITPDEVPHIRFLTPEEETLVKEGKIRFEEAGIALDETNSPYEIKKQLISKDDKLRNDINLRKKLYEDNLRIHKKQIVNYQLSVFEDVKELRYLKTYPPSVIDAKSRDNIDQIVQKDDESPLVKPGERRRKYIKIVSKPSISKTKEKLRERESAKNQTDEYLQDVDDLRINLKYAGILYISDAVKHPKNPQIPNEMLYWLNISSISEVTQYLRNNAYITDAKGMDLIKSNLKELKEKEIKDILADNNLKAGKTKDENIDIICENIERQKLERYNVQNAIHVTKKGHDLVKENPQVETYSKYLYNFKLKVFEEFYQENKKDSLTDIAIGYLRNIRHYYSDKMKWNKFGLTYEAESRIYHDKKDKIMQLKTYINYFICMINPWDDNRLTYYNPIKIGYNEQLIKMVEKTKLSTSKVEELFIQQANTIELPGLFLSTNKMYEYFKRIIENEDIRVINKELTEKYDLNSLKDVSLEFFTKKEEEEVYENVKKYFN